MLNDDNFRKPFIRHRDRGRDWERQRKHQQKCFIKFTAVREFQLIIKFDTEFSLARIIVNNSWNVENIPILLGEICLKFLVEINYMVEYVLFKMTANNGNGCGLR